MNDGDLALAQRAAAGSSDAIRELDQKYAAVIAETCRRFADRGYSADDLKQVLHEKLYVGAAPTIGDYNGEGSLGTWLRVVATRLFIDLKRRKDRIREPLMGSIEPQIAALADLELDLVRDEHRGTVREALRDALAELTREERHLLRQHYAQQLTIDQIAAGLGVHRATVARRIVRARERFGEVTRAKIVAHVQLGGAELEELLGLTDSRVEDSIRTLLATPTPA